MQSFQISVWQKQVLLVIIHLSPQRRLTAKSNVYIFGVVLLEIISGRRAMDNSSGGNDYSLVDWATPYLGDKQKGDYTAANLALQCLNPDAKLRPKMSEVLSTLEQLESAVKPGTKHVQVDSPRSHHHSSVVQKSPVRFSQDRPLLHITPGASPLPSFNQSPRVRYVR